LFFLEEILILSSILSIEQMIALAPTSSTKNLASSLLNILLTGETVAPNFKIAKKNK